ncbi:hypothetical protein AC579_10484 [Pseudocercospora musae]|uniref:Altered inheritance of mitochondria protein 9, mitochondrial n=1 Tax=Pseudocercospora musae TaxID=113226 RepID=A0A139GUE2_9PEZI|nr:hypothetical protein AC579_10484 [Pseudocercospora musae]
MKLPLSTHRHCVRLNTAATPRFRRRQGHIYIRRDSQPHMSGGEGDDREDFFRFTSGRWLWNEEERLRERYRPFNVDALKDIAVSVSGSQACVKMCKLAEGGFNKVFRLTMDNDSTLIARIPNQTSETVSYSLASEVATMDFASKIMDIPVPTVLSWDQNTNNPVGSEYILMSEARGRPLWSSWSSIDIDAKASIVSELVSIEKRLLSASFSQYGNIYFSANRFADCKNIQLLGSISPVLKAQAEENYVIGPVVEHSFWDGERKQIHGVRGPWPTPQKYIRAICEREIAWLTRFADPNKTDDNAFAPAVERDPAVHISLQEKLLKAADYLLPSDVRLQNSVLWHWDLHAPNIFVQDGKITDIIDWQDCWAGPLILQARRPALVDYQGEVLLRLPADFENIRDEEEKRSIRSKVEQSLVLFFYEDETKESNPELTRVYQDIPHRQTICDAITFAANTWDSDIIMLREHWNEICPGKECPFQFTQEEVDAHIRDGQGWNETADFWSSISGMVSRDGFVRTEDYDEALEMFAKLRERGLKTLEGEEREAFDKATRWAETKFQ